MKKYDASMIKVKNVPQLTTLEDNKCCRIYNYCFNSLLPEQNELNKIADGLEEKWIFSKEKYEIPEDIEIIASVGIERLTDYEASISVFTIEPESTCVGMFGMRTLPRKIEEVLGTVKSIQGDARENWITDYKNI